MAAVSVLAVVLFFSRMKWKIVTLSYIYYIEKKQYRHPDEKEMKECTAFVVKNMFKDLIER